MSGVPIIVAIIEISILSMVDIGRMAMKNSGVVGATNMKMSPPRR